LAAWLVEEGQMTSRSFRFITRFPAGLLLTLVGVAIFAAPAHATEKKLVLAPEAAQAMETMYGGDPDAAIEILRGLQRTQPENPQGFLLEAEARWWKVYCAALDVKWGMVDAPKRGKKPEDEAYFALTDKAVQLAQAKIAISDSAEMHVYAGMGWALRARMHGLRGENRAVAHAGVTARYEFLRALQLDPQMADATAGLGLYNYYIDTLSGIVKMLRFFMGIPGGDKREGIRQLEIGMREGTLMAVEARFSLAKNLRTYDQEYDRAAHIIEPLVARYQENPIFLLLLGNLNVELGRNEQAAQFFHTAVNLSLPDAVCAARVKAVANSFPAARP
jgi:tetratricopeptide (TPR) repeat protein